MLFCLQSYKKNQYLCTKEVVIMKEIRWGFIGCGEVTEKKSGPAFDEVPGSKVVAVMSHIRMVHLNFQSHILT